MSKGHDHRDGHRDGHARSLVRALALTGTFMIVEVVAGFVTGSLALLSDAGHMLSDVGALIVSLAAMRIGQREADSRRTFGYYRFEILAAALNAALLTVVAGGILYEAVLRLRTPVEIASGPMLVVAVLGLLVNLLCMRLLHGGASDSLNMKGAYLEVWSDMLGSLGVILAAVVVAGTGWWRADPLVAVLIGLWVLPRSWILLSESVNVLLEGVPEGLHLAEIEEALLAVEGIVAVHDLHVWSITSGRNSLTAHVVLAANMPSEETLRAATEVLRARFSLPHTTLQVEADPCRPHAPGCVMDAPSPE